MPVKWHRYIGIIIKNLAILIIVLLVFGYLVAEGEARAKVYNNDKVFLNNLKMLKARGASGNIEDKARKMTEKALGVDDRWKLVKKYFNFTSRFLTHPHEKDRYGNDLYTYILKTLLLILLTGAIVVPLGLYLGLRAGYKRGKLDKVITVMAPLFSGIPPWFLAILFIYIFYWKLPFLPADFERHLKDALLNGDSTAIAYLVGMILPVATLVLSLVWEYAFNVRNFIRFESESPHVMYDKARGLPDRRIMRKLLRISFPSFLTFTTYNFLDILASVFLVELLFDIRGVGWLLGVSLNVVREGPEGIKFHYCPECIFFSTFIMMVLYFITAVVMESLYVKLDPRSGRETGL
ncbi:hypothetical protein A3L09_00870 [Thermococcus profundus]|uniref:ABC transmembrane type-1 domain-containing protein n=1 Tax=Thermococcus profundus TaxID=49899 RepID=A0A2Z2MBC3_THEPR|nr:ABC transporter permease [Thermococcus profundus]ASJ01912.1 hypothetical protein A3L09_00870 [Thermococcus profundus]